MSATAHFRRAGLALMLAATLLAAACGRPVNPEMIGGVDQIPPGRGLLTGDAGAWTHTF